MNEYIMLALLKDLKVLRNWALHCIFVESYPSKACLPVSDWIPTMKDIRKDAQTLPGQLSRKM